MSREQFCLDVIKDFLVTSEESESTLSDADSEIFGDSDPADPSEEDAPVKFKYYLHETLFPSTSKLCNLTDTGPSGIGKNASKQFSPSKVLGTKRKKTFQDPSSVTGTKNVCCRQRVKKTKIPWPYSSDSEEEEERSWNAEKPDLVDIKRWRPEVLVQLENSPLLPISFFDKFFDDKLWNIIVRETNRYATAKYIAQWRNVTVNELKAFFGLLILMGIKYLPHMEHYWSSDPLLHVSAVADVMTYGRFRNILSSLHMNNSTTRIEKGSSGHDRLHKVRPVINHLKKKFKESYKPSSEQSIGESMILFKGRSSLKQLMQMKPKIKRGYKVWSRVDAATAYLCDFSIYEGKEEERNAGDSLGGSVVKKLCDAIKNTGAQIYFDNYFTSVKLLEELRDDFGIHACGTVPQNRKGLPEMFWESTKEMKQGDHRWQQKNGIVAYVWRDNKDVTVLSNFHDPDNVTKVSRRNRKGRKTDIPCPQAIADYNRFMVGVGRFDQYRNMYVIDRRSKKWWPRIFWFLVDAAIVNSFVLYKLEHARRQLEPPITSYLDFRLQLVRELTAFQTRVKMGRPLKTKPTFLKKKGFGVPDSTRTGNVHVPVKNTTRKRCRYCSSTKKIQSRTFYTCSVCKVPLCTKCFGEFHL